MGRSGDLSPQLPSFLHPHPTPPQCHPASLPSHAACSPPPPFYYSNQCQPHLCSAGKARVLLCVARGAGLGAEHAPLLPLQIGRSVSKRFRCGGMDVLAFNPPLSDCTRINSASPQYHHSLPLEYRYRLSCLTRPGQLGPHYSAVTGLAYRDSSLAIGFLLHHTHRAAALLAIEKKETERHCRKEKMKRRS